MSDQATALGPKFFVLGAFVQSASMMDTWKARGVNTLIETPQGNDALQWAQAADARGLYQIRHPSADLHFDINDPHLLAWATLDEPSDTRSTLDYGVVAQPPIGSPPPVAAPRSSRKKAGIVIAAIGGAFLVGGAVSGIVAWSSAQSVEKASTNGDAFDPSLERTGRTAAVVQWVGYGIGAAGVAVGLILVATAPSAREGVPAPVAALPLIGPGLGGAAVRMTF